MQYKHGDVSNQDIRKLVVGENLSYAVYVGQQFANGNIEITRIEFNGRYSEKFGVPTYNIYAKQGNEEFLWKMPSNKNMVPEFNINF